MNVKRGANVLEKGFLFIAYILFLVPLVFIVNFLFDIVPLEGIQGLTSVFTIHFLLFRFIFCSKSVPNQKKSFNF